MCAILSPTLLVYEWIYALTFPFLQDSHEEQSIFPYMLRVVSESHRPRSRKHSYLQTSVISPKKNTCTPDPDARWAKFQIVDFDDQLHIFLEIFGCLLNMPWSKVLVDPVKSHQPNHTTLSETNNIHYRKHHFMKSFKKRKGWTSSFQLLLFRAICEV